MNSNFFGMVVEAIDENTGFATRMPDGTFANGWTVKMGGKWFDVWTSGTAVVLVLPV